MSSHVARRLLKWAALGALVVAGGIQLLGPQPTNPPVEAARVLRTSAEFDRACRDCHSNETRWPWYSHVAPVRWFVVGHVNHGRSHMNVSEWTSLQPDDADHTLVEICKMVERRKMPLPSYLTMHEDAKLSAQDITALCEWSASLRQPADH